MAGWIDKMLREWRERSAALALRDHVAPLDEAGPPPTHALDLLRIHVARSGVQLTLSDPKQRSPASGHRTAKLTCVDAGSSDPVPERGADDATGFQRFGRRQNSVSAEGATERLSRLPQKALRTPAETRHAAQAFRASAYGEVEALRADMARLKEALADVLVENRSLKRTLEARRDAAVS